MNLASNLTSGDLRKAAKLKQQIEALHTSLNRLLGYTGKAASNGTARVMSPEAKQRIINAQKKRWAAWRKKNR